MDIAKIDVNFKDSDNLNAFNLDFYDAKNKPFDLYGIKYNFKYNKYERMPKEIADTANESVKVLYANTVGGRIRFKTNSKYIAIKAEMPNITRFPHMSILGSSGFTIYIDDEKGSRFYKSFIPSYQQNDGLTGIVEFQDNSEKYLTIYFPILNEVNELYVGIDSGAKIDSGVKYKNIAPTLYYGSSITNGACASRPGNTYQDIISRMNNIDYINLGFSGGAKAETSIIEYLATLECSIFVCDYDHNAPDAIYLQATHENLYKTYRLVKKDIPIIFITKPDVDNNKEAIKRKKIIYNTYKKAKESGDKNVYFIDGKELFGKLNRDCCTVDSCHPNDLGFERMAIRINKTIKEILK